MKTDRTVLLQVSMILTKGSTRGSGKRYVLRGETPQGEFMRIETNPCSESNRNCDIDKQRAGIFEVAVREASVVNPIADQWATSASSGVNLEAEFARQKAIATNQEQDHGQ